MPELRPIHAIRYAPPADGDISTKIAPPYDVLDEGPKQELLAKDPHNVVAIDLPVTPPKTVGPDEAYEGAAKTLQQWLEEGVLKKDDHPSVIAYEQVYRVGSQQYRRRGLFAGLKVEDFNRRGGGIFRHEHTIKSGTDDRMKLMKATGAQLSPVFGVFPDPEKKAISALGEHFDQREPDFHGKTADDNVEHRCWVIQDDETLRKLQEALEPTNVFIADGHHRYTTALNYAKEHPEQKAADSCLFVLVPQQDPGLLVLPTHRVLCGLEGFTMDALQKVLEADGRFELTETRHGADGTPELEKELPDAGHHAVGLYDPVTGKTYTLTTKEADPLKATHPDEPQAWRDLDLTVLHELLVDRVIRPNFGGDSISYKYPHELKEMVVQAHQEEGRLGIITQPTPLEAVCKVSEADGVMPPKSTFFYPKLATGLVINSLEG